jgi:hypothetical protein
VEPYYAKERPDPHKAFLKMIWKLASSDFKERYEINFLFLNQISQKTMFSQVTKNFAIQENSFHCRIVLEVFFGFLRILPAFECLVLLNFRFLRTGDRSTN